ncbi:MAG: hypothetical protein M5U26_04435 [Planctomycetota bacterium]|nr:hypothetical protein [Planctomycetota bacterium]
MALIGPAWVVRGVGQALLDRGFAVRVLALDAETEAAARGLKADAGALAIQTGSLERDEDLARLCEGLKGLAYLSPVGLTGRAWRPESHLEDLKRLLAAAEDRKVERFAYLSTLAADPAAQVRCLREAAEGEKLVHASRVADYMFRSAPLMGPGDDLVAGKLKAARGGGPLMFVWGYSGTTLQPLHVEDLGRCLARAFTKHMDDLQPGVYALAGQETVTELELTDMLLAHERLFKLKLHAPLFMLRMARSLRAGGPAFWDRIALLSAAFFTDRNDAPRILGPQSRMKGLPQTFRELAGA